MIRSARPREVGAYPLAPGITVHWIEDGDHNFTPRVSSGRSERQNWKEALVQLVRFLREVADLP